MRVRQARRILDGMRSRLLRPNWDSLEASAADLSLAVKCLEQIDIGSQSPIWQGAARAEIESEVVELRNSVRAVEDLLRHAGKLYAGLASLLAPDSGPGNYTPSGVSVAPVQESAQRMVLHA